MGPKSNKTRKDDKVTLVFGPLAIECKQAETALLILQSPEDPLVVESCQQLQRFASKGEAYLVHLFNIGCLPILVQSAARPEVVVRRLAFKILALMSEVDIIRPAYHDMGVLQMVEPALIAESDPHLLEFMTCILANLSDSSYGKAFIMQTTVSAAIIDLLSAGDPDIQKNSLQVLENLMEDPLTALDISRLDPFASLMTLLDSEYPVIQKMALQVCNRMTELEAEAAVGIREADGIERLSTILDKLDQMDLHLAVVEVLGNCCRKDEEGANKLIQCGALGRLTRVVNKWKDPIFAQLATSAMALFAKMAASTPISRALLSLDAHLDIIDMLKDTTMPVMQDFHPRAAVAVANFALFPCFRGKMVMDGVVAPLVEISHNQLETLATREAATVALTHLLPDGDLACRLFLEAGGVEVMVSKIHAAGARLNLAPSLGSSMASSELPEEGPKSGTVGMVEEMRMAATKCLGELAMCRPVRHELLQPERGVVSALVISASRPPLRAQAQSFASLSVITRVDQGARKQFFEEDGSKVLLNRGLRARSLAVRKAAWSLIDALATSDPLAGIQLIRDGILDHLLDNMQSVNAYPVLSKAIHSVLKSHPPALFSVTGRLSPNDFITDGFYDAGHWRIGTKYHSLEWYIHYHACPNNVVYYVHFFGAHVQTYRRKLDPGRRYLSYEAKLPKTKSKKIIPPPEVKQEGEVNKPDSSNAGEKKEKEDTVEGQEEEGVKEDEDAEEEEEWDEVSEDDGQGYEPPDQPDKPVMRLQFQEESTGKRNRWAVKLKLPKISMENSLGAYIEEARFCLARCSAKNERAQVGVLGRYVATCFGGPISGPKALMAHVHACKDEVRQWKKTTHCIVVPLGALTSGGFRERSLVYKALGDQLGIPSSLVRGDYGRTWNEVTFLTQCSRDDKVEDESVEWGALTDKVPICDRDIYIVDVVFRPGALLKKGTKQADQYMGL